MKAFLLGWLLVVCAIHASAQTDAPHIKAEAQKCAQALLTGDYAGVVALTPPRVVSMMGGKDAMVATIRNEMEKDKGTGFGLKDIQFGEPEPGRRVGGSWFVSLVPQRMLMKVPGGRLQGDSYMLGISEDEGKTWSFLSIDAISDDQLAQVFPELKGKVQLPPKTKPVLTKE